MGTRNMKYDEWPGPLAIAEGAPSSVFEGGSWV
jgi:hypothetical protein